MQRIAKEFLIGTLAPVPLVFHHVKHYGTPQPTSVICIPEPAAGKYYRLFMKDEQEIVLSSQRLVWETINDQLVLFSYLDLLCSAQLETFRLLSAWCTAGMHLKPITRPLWQNYCQELYGETLENFFFEQGKLLRKAHA